MTAGTITAQQDSLGPFRAMVMADLALTETLSRPTDPDEFVALATQIAGRRGIVLDAQALRNAIRPDPLGLARWLATPLLGSKWPPPSWFPIQAAAQDGRAVVDWAYFGNMPLTQPFYEDSIRRALGRPFNRMFSYRMALDDFLNDAASAQSLPPSGFIFHMSRCGSTLVTQMLAALPRHVTISEAAPIDAAVQMSRTWPDLPAAQQDKVLTSMVAAFARPRSGEQRCFIKLDSWHTLALPLFRRVFPATPWIFLYRDPVEVLVSQMQQRGSQMVPEFVPPTLYGIDGAHHMPADEYCARVLAKICRAAASETGGLLVNYRDLPQIFWRGILPHFGVQPSKREREIMARPARYHAKSPQVEFAGDSEAKQRQATEAIRAQAERHLGEVYRRLEELRGAQAC